MTFADTYPSLRSEDRTDIGSRIKEARLAAGFNRNQLARRLGTSWALVNQWENGKTTPSLKSLRRIADELGVDTDRLLGTPSAKPNEAFEEYLRVYLPDDLTPEEIAWLQSAPAAGEQLSPDAYAAIVRALRGNRRGLSEPVATNRSSESA